MALSKNRKNRWILSVVVLLSCVVLPNCGGGGGSSSDSGGGSGSNSGGLTVSAISPLNAATGVAAGTNIVATFSSSVEETTLSGNFTLTCGGTAVTGTITYDAANKQATFDPASDLTEGAVCTVTLSAGIKTSDGVALTAFSPTFTVTTTALEVSSVKDTAGNTISTTGSTISPDNTTLTVTFSKSMDESTISTSTITLSCNGASITVSPIKVSATEYDFTYSNQPQNDCTFTIVGGASGIKDISGNTMSTDATYTIGSTCDADDEFTSSDTLTSCWTQQNSDYLQTPLSTANSILTFSVAAADASQTSMPCIYKDIAGNFAAALYISNNGASASLAAAGLKVWEIGETVNNLLFIQHGRIGAPGKQARTDYTIEGSSTQGSAAAVNLTSVKLCIVKNGTSVTAEYKTTGDWTPWPSSPVSITLGDITHVGICGYSTSAGGGLMFQSDWIKFDFSSDPSCTTE